MRCLPVAAFILVLAGCQTVAPPLEPMATSVLDAAIQPIEEPIVVRYGPHPEQAATMTISVRATGRLSKKITIVQRSRRQVEQVGDDLVFRGETEPLEILEGKLDVEQPPMIVRVLMTPRGEIQDVNMVYVVEGQSIQASESQIDAVFDEFRLLGTELPPSGLRTGDRLATIKGMSVDEGVTVSGYTAVMGTSRYRGREVVVLDMEFAASISDLDLRLPMKGLALLDRSNLSTLYMSMGGMQEIEGVRLDFIITEEVALD